MSRSNQQQQNQRSGGSALPVAEQQLRQTAPALPKAVTTGPAGGGRDACIAAGVRRLARGSSAFRKARELHRDLEPSDAIVSRARVVAMDFGLGSRVGSGRLSQSLARSAGDPIVLARCGRAPRDCAALEVRSVSQRRQAS